MENTMPLRALSREAFLWCTIASAEYLDQARAHLRSAYDLLTADFRAAPSVQDYPPVSCWGGEMQRLLQTYPHARAALQHGEFQPMISFCGGLMSLPRGLTEGVTSWMGHVNEFWENVDSAYSVCSSFSRCIQMSQMYCGERYKDGSGDWRVEIPEDIGPSAWSILSKEEYVFPVVPNLIPEYTPDPSVSCMTGEIVPWTGVWVPSTGMGTAALAFARQGIQIMQPAYEIARMDEDNEYVEEFRLVECTWHPVRPTGRMIPHPALAASGSVRGREGDGDRWQGRCEAGLPCPREG